MKNVTEKAEKVFKKFSSKNQSLDIRRLALKKRNDSEINTFKNVFSDLSTGILDNRTLDQALDQELILI